METGLFVADALHGFTDDVLDFLLRAVFPVTVLVDHALAAHFARQDDALGGGQGLAGDASFRVLGEEEIDDGVGNLVRNLVGMAFRDALGGKDIVISHRDTTYKEIFMWVMV